MTAGRSKYALFIAALLILLLGFRINAATQTQAVDQDTESTARGLAGKKGQSAEADDNAKTSSYAEPVEVYKGHLDTVVLIYMVGSNLESQNGLGTKDIHEICDAYKKAGKSDQPVKFVVQTGGANSWSPDFKIPADKSARFEVVGEEFVLKQEFELANMANPGTLSDFIAWGMASYPADRYGLILWDHGGGPVLGFGADETHSGSMMRLQQLKKAFETAGGRFAFIGFDACLMGTVETAYMLKPFADYMIASEEMEPGNGWYYTNWVGALLKDPKVSVETFGKMIVDDFAESNEKEGNLYTLSLIDLEKLDDVYKKLMDFAGQSEKALEADKYVTLSKARYDTRSFGNGGYDQIDIIDYVDKAGVAGGDTLKSSVKNAIVHFRSNMEGANGLAMYYPYDYLDQYSRMYQLLETLEFDKVYRDYFSGFCTIRTLSDEETSRGNGFSSEDWYRPDMKRMYSAEAEPVLPTLLPYKTIGDKTVIDIPREEMAKMTFVAMHVWADEGTGFQELGRDIISEAYFYDSSSKNPSLLDHETADTDEYCIVADYDKTWITINDKVVPYDLADYGTKITEKGEEITYYYGDVLALLTREGKKGEPGISDEMVVLRVAIEMTPHTGKLTENSVDARVCGYWVVDEMSLEGGDSVRNLQQFKEGDKLTFVSYFCEYGNPEEEILEWPGTLTVPKEGLTVGYADLKDYSFNICFELWDVFQNVYYTDWRYID
ncbi:MAG: hypothetical protein K5770_03625 [Lachnospiraceae bacterium]|nr:hypothetical protein [Lachnospiraceae bacterium]